MPNMTKEEFIGKLETSNTSAGTFGVCYSILTWGGIFKGLSLRSPSSWLKSAVKSFANGHATTFLYDREEETLTTSGMSDEGWVFSDDEEWARPTVNATTYVYYIDVDQDFINDFNGLKVDLELDTDVSTHMEKVGKKNKKITTVTGTQYGEFMPNFTYHPGRNEDWYENCVSHSHYLMYELGVARWTALPKNGWWMPSTANWMNWISTLVPIGQGSHGKWKYKVFPGWNTHIPG